MRIGLFTDSYPPYINGVSTSVENLRNALTKLGHTVYVVTVNNSLTKWKYDENTKILRIPGVPTRIYDYRLCNYYSHSIYKLIKSWNLDIIHSHTEFGIGMLARKIAKKNKLPLVHTYHTLYEDYTHYVTKGHFNKFSKKVVKKLTIYFCKKTAQHTIVPTNKIDKLFKEKYDITENVSVIPTGINLDKFLKVNISKQAVKEIKEKYNILPSDYVIISVGRLAKEKNFEFLLKAHQQLLTKTKKSIKFLIVGDGPDKDKYIDLSRELNIYDKVIFTGAIPQEEIQAYYHCANIFATASRSETQGLTVIEAIASDIIPLCIDDAVFTKLLPKDCIFTNQDDYINKVLSNMNLPLLHITTKKKLKEVMKEYSMETYAKKVLTIYNRVIEKYNTKKK